MIEEERALRAPEMLEGPARLRPEATADQDARARADPLRAEHGASARSSSTASPAAARPRSTSAPSSGRSRRAGARSSSCPRSRSRRCSCAPRSAGSGGIVSVLHSELSAGERHDQWWRIREGEARVVVGARSAVFAPAGRPRPHRRRRGARGGLQAGREPALPRARRGGDARAARRRGRGARLGHAVARVVRQRARGKYRRLVLPRAHRPPGPAAGRGGGPAAGAQGRGGPDPHPAAARRARGAARAQGAVAAAAEPPRLRHEPPLPRVRPAGHVPQLLGRRSRCTRAGASRSATTAATRRRTPPRLRDRARASTCASRLRHGEGARGACARRCRRRASSASTATWPCRRGAVARVLAAFEAGRDGHPGRHADDRQGPRLPARHAGGRGGRGRGPRPARLPRRRAHVPAPHPGRGPRRARRTCRAR